MSNPGGTGTPADRPGARAYQMLWDCRFCGTTKLLGLDHRHCPNCGGAQDPSWRYFPSDEDKREVTAADYRYAGVDKICPFCNQPNSAAANFCQQCGGDLTGAQQAEVRSAIIKGSAEDTGQARDLVLERFQKEQAAARAQARGGKSRLPTCLIVGVVAIIAIIAAVIFLSQSTYRASIQVSDVGWERVIAVEQLTTLSGSGWRETVPGDAYNRSCYTRDREYTVPEQYECGTIRVDRGDGTFIEQPRMCTRNRTEYRPDTWCDYNYDRWQHVRDLRTAGGLTDPLVWPAFSPSGSGTGAQREGGRQEILSVSFSGLGDKARQRFTYNPAREAEWRSFQIGQQYSVEINRLEQVQWDTLQLSGGGG